MGFKSNFYICHISNCWIFCISLFQPSQLLIGFKPWNISVTMTSLMMNYQKMVDLNTVHQVILKSISLQLISPSAVYMRQWIGSVLIQIKAYSTPSHYLHQCWVIVNWAIRNKLQWNFNQNTKISFHENTSETIVCEMTVILSSGDGVGWWMS